MTKQGVSSHLQAKSQVNGEHVNLQGVVMSYNSLCKKGQEEDMTCENTHRTEADLREKITWVQTVLDASKASHPKLLQSRETRENVKNAVSLRRSSTGVHVSRDHCQSEHLVPNLEMLVRTRKSPNILEERKLPAFVV